MMLLLAACGGGELTVTEYVAELNALMGRVIPQGEALFASPEGAVLVEGADLDQFTPQDLEVALLRIADIEDEVNESIADIEPPALVADFHNLFFDTRYATAREALAVRAAAATSWEELSATPEMDAYRTAVAVDKQACVDFQNDMDATEARGAFDDTPWIPGELKEVVTAALGCATFHDNPQDMFRP